MGNKESKEQEKDPGAKYLVDNVEEQLKGDQEFLGQKVFVDINSRTELPILKKDEPVPLWEILKKVIGKDMTKVSLPVSMNEPLSGLQRNAEMMVIMEDLMIQAA